MTTYTRAGDIAAELAARLARIRTANGFETEIGRDVKRGKRKVPADDAPPCVVMIEGNDDPQDRPGRIPMVLVQQSYMFDAFDRCDPDNPNDQAHKMIRDLKRTIFAGDATLGGKVSKVIYQGRDIGPRPDGAALVQVRVLIDVEFVEDLTNP
jgi:hypothetical protein